MSHWIALLNQAGESWASWMLHMSWQVALLAVVVWLLCRVLHYSAARFRHLLWLTVFLKLVLPPMLATPWSAGTLISMAEVPAVVVVDSEAFEFDSENESAYAPTAVPLPQTPIMHTADAKTSVEVPVAARPLGVAGVALSRRAQMMIAWALVCLVFAAGVATQHRRFIRHLLRSAEIAPESIQAHVRACAEHWGVAKEILVMVSREIHTPTVFGVRRPVILLPTEWSSTFTEEEIANILAHEVAHVKRKDLLLTGIAGVLTCVYWFHPAVWIANLYQRREREMACDDLVLESKRDAGKAYAATLLRVAEHFTGRVPAFAGFLGLIELSDSLLHRVLSATDARRPRRLGWKSAIVLVAIAAMLPMGTWTATAQNNPAQEAAAAAASAPAPTPGSEAIEAEIRAHYEKASMDVVDFVRWTAGNFGGRGLWLPENAFEGLTAEQREAKVKECEEVLKGEYGRQQCGALAAAGVLKDKRLLPGVMKAATFHLEGQDYDCRTKWIAVEAAGRFDDISVAPQLIPLVDHGNKNVRMWARASLVRLTGQNFDADKQAWGTWWNESGKDPKIDLSQLKPWVPPATVAAETAAQTLPVVGAEAVAPEAQAVVDGLPGELVFKAGYHHRSRGGDFPNQSTVWIKKTPDKAISAACYMPSLSATMVAHVGAIGSVSRYDQFMHGGAGKPSSEQHMILTPGKVTITHKGGPKDGQSETYTAPEANQFQPNTRPDPYIAHMALAMQGLPMKDVDLACYDWDNTGKGMGAYTTKVVYKGKEDVTVPAGVFNAQHYVETQTSSGNTWFKKAEGHVTEYWCLDNGVMVRVFRHREPYEVLLATVESPEKLPGYVGKAPQAAPAAAAPQARVEPNIVSITPAFNATEVDPATTEITIVFDQDMASGFSWTGGGEQFPKTTGRPSWRDKRTCVLPVQLEPAKLYRVGINSKSHQNFRTVAGVPVAPRVLVFTTKGADAALVASIQPPKIAKCEPENGATGVSPALDTITVTFDVPMGGGFSWTGSGDDYPETTGSPRWSDDKKTCTMPVKLKPDWTYRIGLNSTHHNNFQSASGVPLEPVAYSFSTGK